MIAASIAASVAVSIAACVTAACFPCQLPPVRAALPHVPIWKPEGLGPGSQGAKEQREDQLRRFGGAGVHMARQGKERSEAGRQRDELGERPSEISDG